MRCGVLPCSIMLARHITADPFAERSKLRREPSRCTATGISTWSVANPTVSFSAIFQVELTERGRVLARAQVVSQLGLGTLEEAHELLEVIGNAAIEYGIASA